MCLQFGFVIFWQKDFGAKAAHKMLVKLKPVWRSIITLTRPNFIKHFTALIYERLLQARVFVPDKSFHFPALSNVGE